MNLNEDGTITLSMKETQEYATKIINPRYRTLKRIRKWHKNASEQDLQQISHNLRSTTKLLETFVLTYKCDVTKAHIKELERYLSRLVWALECAGMPMKDELDELKEETEKAYNLYQMLLKNRRLIDDE